MNNVEAQRVVSDAADWAEDIYCQWTADRLRDVQEWLTSPNSPLAVGNAVAYLDLIEAEGMGEWMTQTNDRRDGYEWHGQDGSYLAAPTRVELAAKVRTRLGDAPLAETSEQPTTNPQADDGGDPNEVVTDPEVLRFWLAGKRHDAEAKGQQGLVKILRGLRRLTFLADPQTAVDRAVGEWFRGHTGDLSEVVLLTYELALGYANRARLRQQDQPAADGAADDAEFGVDALGVERIVGDSAWVHEQPAPTMLHIRRTDRGSNPLRRV